MLTCRVISSLFVLVLILTLPLYAENKDDIYDEGWLAARAAKADQAFKKKLIADSYSQNIAPSKKSFFSRWLNSKVYASQNPRTENLDRIKLRELWQDFLGFDVFYPYFKTKELEEYLSDKTAIKILDIKGRTEFDETSQQVRYIFKKKF